MALPGPFSCFSKNSLLREVTLQGHLPAFAAGARLSSVSLYVVRQTLGSLCRQAFLLSTIPIMGPVSEAAERALESLRGRCIVTVVVGPVPTARA